MPECDHCDASFADEDAYLEHLASTHKEALGRIDRRRVNDYRGISDDDGDSHGIALYGFAAVLGVLVLAVIGYVIAIGVSEDGTVHDHGQITVEVDGEPIDFEQQQYYSQELDGTFHFHPNDGNIWHMHPDRVALEEAMADITMPITESAIEIEGETYDDGDPETSVETTVNGESIDLDYVLQDGDDIHVVVETPDGGEDDGSNNSDDSESDDHDEAVDATDTSDG